jgi:hypothetical protein
MTIPEPPTPEDIPLTDEERKAIASLERLAKRWPQSLKLFSRSGSLCSGGSKGKLVLREPPGRGHLSLI